MATDILTSTTLSEDITAAQDVFSIGSTTGVTAGSSLLVIGNEAMKVVEIPVSGQVKVIRGWAGTYAKPHTSGRRVFEGTPDEFKVIKGSAIGLNIDEQELPDFPLPGQIARDGYGNEYVLCELTAVTYAGTTVLISKDLNFKATVVAAGENGPVGLTTEYGTSDQYIWVQRRGYNTYAQDTVGDSAGTSAQYCLVATTASTPSVGLAVDAGSSFSSVAGTGSYHIFGMFLSGAATTATTSAASATGVAYPVFLNYPFVTGFQTRTAATS